MFNFKSWLSSQLPKRFASLNESLKYRAEDWDDYNDRKMQLLMFKLESYDEFTGDNSDFFCGFVGFMMASLVKMLERDTNLTADQIIRSFVFRSSIPSGVKPKITEMLIKEFKYHNNR
jgi:hypothetical protein